MNGGTNEMMFSVILGVAVIVGISLQLLFFHRLRHKYPDEWASLGSPHLFRPSDIQSGWVITKYFFTGAFAKLEDKSVRRLGRVVQWYNWFGLVGFVFLTALFFYAIFR